MGAVPGREIFLPERFKESHPSNSCYCLILGGIVRINGARPQGNADELAENKVYATEGVYNLDLIAPAVA